MSFSLQSLLTWWGIDVCFAECVRSEYEVATVDTVRKPALVQWQGISR